MSGDRTSIAILGMDGRMVKVKSGYESEYRINTYGYPKGVYIVQVRNSSIVSSRKLIIH